MLKRSELSKGFQGKVFKDRVREGHCGVCDQLVDTLLIGNRESTSSAFWSRLFWGLCACGQPTVNFSHLMGVSVAAKQLKDYGSEHYP